jgi:hypothetical protein
MGGGGKALIEAGDPRHRLEKTMPEITPNMKLLLGMISVGAALAAVLVGIVLAAGAAAYFTGRRSRAIRHPLVPWTLFFISVAISLVAGSIAAFAPVASERPLPTRQAQSAPASSVSSEPGWARLEGQ